MAGVKRVVEYPYPPEDVGVALTERRVIARDAGLREDGIGESDAGIEGRSASLTFHIALCD